MCELHWQYYVSRFTTGWPLWMGIVSSSGHVCEIFISTSCNNSMPVIMLESIIVAAPDQTVSTNCVKNDISKEEIDSKCWLCKQHEETVDHLTSGCAIFVKDEYLMRHDKACAHLHYSICTALGIETTDNWYNYMPQPVYELEDIAVLWNQAVHTDREVTANRPDITIKNKKNWKYAHYYMWQ